MTTNNHKQLDSSYIFTPFEVVKATAICSNNTAHCRNLPADCRKKTALCRKPAASCRKVSATDILLLQVAGTFLHSALNFPQIAEAKTHQVSL